MNRFIARRRELKALERLYARPGFQMTIMYGRRRVGKTTLLQQFVAGKKFVYYTAIRSSSQRNLELLGQRVIEALDPDMKGMAFQSYEQVFAFIGNKSREERLVFIIDEFPYMAETNKSLLSILQKHIDSDWIFGNMYLLLCGSQVSFMEDEVLSEKSPLHGRRTSQIALKPFDYLDAARFVPDYTPEEKAIVYGVTGGIAKYLSLFDSTRPLKENLLELFFSNDGFMYEEPTNILTQEFRSVPTYSAVIEAVASGRTKLSGIADLTKLEPPTVSHAVSNLISTGILKKEYAITEESNKKKVQYRLADHMFRFWYRFVVPYIDIIDIGAGNLHYERVVKLRINDYMSDVFEDMCRYYTLQIGVKGELPCIVNKTGRWWGTNPIKKEETDLDVVGIDDVEKKAVLGECKFRNEVADKKVFDELKDRLGLIDRRYRVVKFLLFSKSGFSDWIIQAQKSYDLLAIDLEAMYSLEKVA